MKPNYQKIQNLTPLVTSKSPGTKKGLKVNNFTNNWNKKLKFGICTNLWHEECSDKIEVSKISKFDPVSDVTFPRDQKRVTKQTTYKNNRNTNLKLDTCTNFDTRNSVMKPKYQKIQNLTPLVTSQSPGTKKGSKANNFTNNWNKQLKLEHLH